MNKNPVAVDRGHPYGSSPRPEDLDPYPYEKHPYRLRGVDLKEYLQMYTEKLMG